MTRSTYPSVAESHGPRGPLSATTLSIFSTMLSHPSTFRLSSATTSDEKRRESKRERSRWSIGWRSKVLDNKEPIVHVPCFLKKSLFIARCLFVFFQAVWSSKEAATKNFSSMCHTCWKSCWSLPDLLCFFAFPWFRNKRVTTCCLFRQRSKENKETNVPSIRIVSPLFHNTFARRQLATIPRTNIALTRSSDYTVSILNNMFL